MFFKKFFFIFIFLFSTNTLASGNVAYIDIDFILNNSLRGKLIIKQLNELNEKNLIDLQNKEKQLENEKKEINDKQNTLSNDELNKKIKNFQNKAKLYQKEKDTMFKNINEIKKKKINNFISEISPVIEKFMKKNTISLLIDKKSVFIADPKYDITKNVLAVIDEKLKND